MNSLKRTLVWDLPTRMFHWMLAGFFFTSAFIAWVLGDDSRFFPYHAIMGLVMPLMVVMRILWGFIGSRYARFHSFAFGAHAVIDYMGGVLSGARERYIGHNPGGAWAFFALFFLVLGLTITGMLIGQGKERVKDLHEFFACTMVAVVVLHIFGVLLHTIRHHENIVTSMVHGRKAVDVQVGIVSSHPLAALIFCVACGSWGVGLIANYDAATQTTRLPIIGISVQVGEVEDEHRKKKSFHHDNDD